MQKWKTLSSEYMYKSPFGNHRKDCVELPDGHKINNYYVNEYDDWVNAVVLTKERKIVLVQQYRHAAGDCFLEIPAGKVEKGETYEEAILREVEEETGFTSEQRPIKLGEFFVNPATQTNKVISYLILDAFQEYTQALDPTEIIDIHIIDIDQMENLIATGKINQLFTVSAYYMVKSYLMSRLKEV
ncbi:NUDIX hydrolase [Ornithinibacillus halotolerans]|uniref:DNA mismatch repair protein MutT n=1 Tax=Ornithinibacillus halotolerans TaxID=1274357 RepID=A0A916S2X2_9BACI|nr:NUDIX hydrolase [Ornithinibacillus halotolerans]GGA80805.1 DNA mismatch repair protein MutT [Ornithinibacillus halotolerans]